MLSAPTRPHTAAPRDIHDADWWHARLPLVEPRDIDRDGLLALPRQFNTGEAQS